MPQDWFEQNAPQQTAQPQADWFDSNVPKASAKPSGGPPKPPDDPYVIKPMSIGPFESGLRQSTVKKITSELPIVGGIAGAAAGEGIGSIPGAAIGGAAGESGRQLINRFLGIKDEGTDTSSGASEGIGKAGLEQGAIEAATMGAGKVLKPIGGALIDSAKEGLGKVLAPTTIATKAAAKKVLPRMVDEAPIALTRKGLLENVGTSLRGAGKALDEALQKVPTGTTLSSGQIANVTGRLDALASSFMTKTASGGMAVVPGAEASVGFINGMKDFIQQSDPSFESIRNIRKVLDGLVDKSGKFNMTAAEGSEKEIQRFTADALRGELAKAAPDVAAANRDYSFYKGIQTVLEKTIERTTGQQGNLTRRILMAGGATAGSPYGIAGAFTGAAVMKALAQVADSTAWRTVSAATKSKIANLIATDQLGEASALITRIGMGVNAYNKNNPPTREEFDKSQGAQ